MYEFCIQVDEYYKPVKHFFTEELFEKIIKSKFFKKQQKKISKMSNDIQKMTLNEQFLKYYVEPTLLKKMLSKSLSKKKSKTLSKPKSRSRSRSRSNSLSNPKSRRSRSNSLSNPKSRRSRSNSLIKPKSRSRSNSLIKPKSYRSKKYTSPYYPSTTNYMMAPGGGDQNNEYTFMNSVFIPLALFAIFQLYRINTTKPVSRHNIREIRDISGDKERVRLVFSLVKDNGHMDFLKVSALENDTTKEEILQNPQILYDDFGEYVYECRIYDEMNKETGVNYKGKDISKYVSEILDWNIKEIDLTIIIQLKHLW